MLRLYSIPELVGYVGGGDKLYSKMLISGLTRTKTLAEGGERCDFRLKRGGATRVTVPESLRTLRDSPHLGVPLLKIDRIKQRGDRQ